MASRSKLKQMKFSTMRRWVKRGATLASQEWRVVLLARERFTYKAIARQVFGTLDDEALAGRIGRSFGVKVMDERRGETLEAERAMRTIDSGAKQKAEQQDGKHPPVIKPRKKKKTSAKRTAKPTLKLVGAKRNKAAAKTKSRAAS